ncbi:MAG: hypothetical protein A2Y23_13950 [Clostridiales bacterium GWB2_37_7]|nr:MAG: hypothetical protein A2Y23_13950 [Clostridiales bacterium GWB2_37_7]
MKDGEGIIWVVDANTGSRLMHFQKAYAEDSNEQITQNISTDIAMEAGKEILVLTVDNAWIASAAFPVVIDPTLVVSIELADPSNIQDAYIAGGYPNNSYYTNNYLHVGYLAGYNFIRSLIKFIDLPSLPLGAKITSASLNMLVVQLWMSLP